MFDILIVDDEKDIREVMAGILSDEGYAPRTAKSAGECMKILKKKCPDILLLDIWLKDSNIDGIDILKYAKKNHPEVPVVIISGHGTIEIAVAAIKQGAYDFIEKPFNASQLLVIIERAREAANLRQKDTNRQRPNPDDFCIDGKSNAMVALRKELSLLASKNSRILLQGEIGVGKYRVARFIHAISNRADAAFHYIDCTKPDWALDADTPAKSLFESADGGVLYLNNISKLSSKGQDQLLSSLTSQQEEDCRIISATCTPLKDEVKKGTFNHLLYDRLTTITLDIPNLKQRVDDIEELAENFIKEISDKAHFCRRPLSQEALIRLKNAHWRGNLRQLKNLLEHVLIFGPRDADIPISETELLQQHCPFKNEFDGGADISEKSPPITSLPLREARQIFEKKYLSQQIQRFGGNISRTSNFIGMERSALHRKLKSLNITASDEDSSE